MSAILISEWEFLIVMLSNRRPISAFLSCEREILIRLHVSAIVVSVWEFLIQLRSTDDPAAGSPLTCSLLGSFREVSSYDCLGEERKVDHCVRLALEAVAWGWCWLGRLVKSSVSSFLPPLSQKLENNAPLLSFLARTEKKKLPSPLSLPTICAPLKWQSKI